MGASYSSGLREAGHCEWSNCGSASSTHTSFSQLEPPHPRPCIKSIQSNFSLPQKIVHAYTLDPICWLNGPLLNITHVILVVFVSCRHQPRQLLQNQPFPWWQRLWHWQLRVPAAWVSHSCLLWLGFFKTDSPTGKSNILYLALEQ